MEDKITRLMNRLDEVEELLGKPESLVDQKFYKELTQEHSYLAELRDVWLYYKKIIVQIDENKDLLISEKDDELIQIIKEELEALGKEKEITQKRLETILVPPDPNDNRNIIVEIRAGTGGDEAALFVGDLARMYKCYAETKGWRYENLGAMASEVGGYREYFFGISGANVFRLMQYEAGTHRVQRVPETETQGRLHTSAATVAVLMEPDENEQVDIDERDLVIDTYRASGAGGQHVNTTDSAVRITHVPTKTVVCCQDERSQHKNKATAMRLLSAKIVEQKRMQLQKERSELRSTQVGTGDRSERIRTYNFPQNRVTDHRIDVTLYKLDHVMQGDLDDIIMPLVSFFYQQKLSS
jgi:peptide chain release factor 1